MANQVKCSCCRLKSCCVAFNLRFIYPKPRQPFLAAIVNLAYSTEQCFILVIRTTKKEAFADVSGLQETCHVSQRSLTGQRYTDEATLSIKLYYKEVALKLKRPPPPPCSTNEEWTRVPASNPEDLFILLAHVDLPTTRNTRAVMGLFYVLIGFNYAGAHR